MYVAVIACSAAAILLGYAGLSAIFSDERAVARHLKNLTAYESAEARNANPILRSFAERVARPALNKAVDIVVSTTPAGYERTLARRLAAAGQPRDMTPERLIGLKVCVAFASACALSAAALLSRANAGGWLLVAGSSVGSFWLPDVWLSARADSRRTAIRRALPDMLDMLTISVEAGLGFDQAVGRLVRSTSGPLSEELGRALQRVQAGVDRSDALRQLSDTCDVEELRTFVTAIVQAEVLGVSISKVLRNLSKEMRLVRRQRAEERAQKAPVKLVFPLVLCILPATIIVIMGPAIIRIGRAFGLL